MTLLPCYNSMFVDWYTEGVDAFTHNWAGENNWINAPFGLLGHIVKKIWTDKATASVVAPLWKGAPWMKDLFQLSVHPPFQLPRVPELCHWAVGHPELLQNLHLELFV